MASFNGTYADGFLLYKTPFRETESMCDLLLANIGRIRCRLKVPTLQFYRPFEIKLTYRRGYYSATDFRYLGSELITEQAAMLMGMYLNEILFKLGEYEQPNAHLFTTYTRALAHLEHGIDVQRSIREFEQALLMSIGQAVDYAFTHNNTRISVDARYDFVALQGFFENPNGFYSGLLINCIAQRDFRQQGALAVFRQINQAQIDALLDGRLINSRALSSAVFKTDGK